MNTNESYDDRQIAKPLRTCPKCGRQYYMARETCAACRERPKPKPVEKDTGGTVCTDP